MRRRVRSEEEGEEGGVWRSVRSEEEGGESMRKSTWRCDVRRRRVRRVRRNAEECEEGGAGRSVRSDHEEGEENEEERGGV